MQITMTKDALVAKLKERLTAAQAEDARVERLHHADEQKALKEFREKLRAALKWDYATAKKDGRYGVEMKSPSCPRRESVSIDRVLKMVTLATSETFAIKTGSDVYDAISWQPESERVGRTVCD